MIDSANSKTQTTPLGELIQQGKDLSIPDVVDAAGESVITISIKTANGDRSIQWWWDFNFGPMVFGNQGNKKTEQVQQDIGMVLLLMPKAWLWPTNTWCQIPKHNIRLLIKKATSIRSRKFIEILRMIWQFFRLQGLRSPHTSRWFWWRQSGEKCDRHRHCLGWVSQYRDDRCGVRFGSRYYCRQRPVAVWTNWWRDPNGCRDQPW